MFKIAAAGATALLVTISSARSDQVVSMNQAFTGPNIYSPDVYYDPQQGIIDMWYGGWQVSGQTNDNIYLRQSSSYTSWPTSYQTVLTNTEASQQWQQQSGQNIPIVHVNDPTVTKFYNSVSQQYQYTMFYSVSTNGQNSIWSSVSNDATHWFYS